jgi:hypothetical protein
MFRGFSRLFQRRIYTKSTDLYLNIYSKRFLRQPLGRAISLTHRAPARDENDDLCVAPFVVYKNAKLKGQLGADLEDVNIPIRALIGYG